MCLVTLVPAIPLYGVFSQISLLQIREVFTPRCSLAVILMPNLLGCLHRRLASGPRPTAVPPLLLAVHFVLLLFCLGSITVVIHLGRGDRRLLLVTTALHSADTAAARAPFRSSSKPHRYT